MFTDWTEALEAEGLPIDPTTTEQEAAAARVTARNADSKEDLVLLLDVLGLPGDDDTLTPLLPLLPSSEGDPDMPQTQTSKTPNAFEATALSMYYADATTAEITEATGLTEDEITALVSAQEEKTEAMLEAEEKGAAVTAEPAATDTASGDSVEQLLAWAEAHPVASIRNKAARVRGDLAELTARHTIDDAQRKAEERVATLKAELDKAQDELRAIKTGTLPSPTATAVAVPAPTPIRSGLGSGRTKEELADIRTWARANGHKVADAGIVAKKILDAYDAAHPAPAAKAS
ncbi:histone-like nucleoid-structuring protein Lsr2 [Streptomyces sp. NPDC057877]|uniref:Lsr2 family DNA-binding protein n=1 Tax=Streptomyces sp. NPDC057877 TaxID=3346269 RepID=UPI0036B1D205